MSKHSLSARLVGNPGAAIIYVYLTCMTPIVGGAYAVLDTLFNAPAVNAEVTDKMPLLSRASDLPGSRAVRPLERPGLSNPEQVKKAFTFQERSGAMADGLEMYARPRLRPRAFEAHNGGPLVSVRPRLRLSDSAHRSVTDDAGRLANLLVRRNLEYSEQNTAPDMAISARCPKRLVLSIPPRKGTAEGASALLADVKGIVGPKRDQMVVAELLKGNIPSFQRNLVPVTLRGITSEGRQANLTICVTPDYLALGSDRDFARVPLGLNSASRVARSFKMVLPTPRMVDAIYSQAAVRLKPHPMTPGPQMTSTSYFIRHNATVEAQRRRAGARHGNLISGHKKDVVLTTRLASNRGRVAIYGWHRLNGTPIQPLSTVHRADYVDYSHGIRLVSRIAYLDGQEIDLRNYITTFGVMGEKNSN